jgi:hypothetical protein
MRRSAHVARSTRSSLRGRIRWQAVAVAAVAMLVAVFGLVVAAGGTATQPAGDASLGVHALQNLSEFEKQVLADKHVTPEEMDEALHTYTDCLSEAGMRYEIQPGPRGMGNVLTFGGPANGWPSGTEQDFDVAMERCVDQVSAVQNVWILQNYTVGTYPQPLPGLQEALDALDTSGW